MRLLEGVKLVGIRPETVIGITAAKWAYEKAGAVLTVTSIVDGKHSRGSLHYVGYAFDCRIRDLSPDQLDIVVEDDHIHVEYQPK